MQYTETECIIHPATDENKEIAIAIMSKFEYEGFTENDHGILAYITSAKYSESILEQVKSELPENFLITFSSTVIEDKNWNEIWESNYEPVKIENEVLIVAPFHKNYQPLKYTITIMPKMSFGTGHHETTKLMIEELLRIELTGKEVIDIGCGTGILSILASQLGASLVTAIDNDLIAVENCSENVNRNKNNGINVSLGDRNLLSNMLADIVLANINFNTLKSDFSYYKNALKQDGILIVSGFYVNELAPIIAVALQNGLTFQAHANKNKWSVASFANL